MSRTGESWGRYVRADQRIVHLVDRNLALPPQSAPALAYGNGRSYGDSCLNHDGVLFATRELDRFIAFDPASGRLTCEAGVLFSEILELIVPRGWFLPVTPGTRYITVGGAIANDVHGKNHHRAGTFGHHVESLDLLRTDGSRVECSSTSYPELFTATIGGLGLTGVVVAATIRLTRIPSPYVSSESIKFSSLGDFFALSSESAEDHEYTVAWVDCTRGTKDAGRGLFSRANHVPAQTAVRAKKQRSVPMPILPPISLVNPISLKAFNALYYAKQRSRLVHSISHYEPFFYPLDGIRDWNRLYGPRGFLQYQSVVPHAAAADVTRAMLSEIHRAGAGSFLAVLKQFGDIESRGVLSFPRPGTTLALDFPNRGQETLRLLDRLDALTEEAGGAVYPAKDARMSGSRFRQYFPRWQELEKWRDPGISSSFWRRVMG